MNKKIWLGVALLILVLAGGLAVAKQRQIVNRTDDSIAKDDKSELLETSDDSKEQGENGDDGTEIAPIQLVDTTTPPGQAPAPKVAGYTLSDVSSHNSKTSCWAAVNGNVYDLTSWIGKHPGGEAAIEQICGKDGSALFNGQHGGAAKQASILATFKIGVLQ